MSETFLLGLIGIPSVGKTTFARRLAKNLEENGHLTIIIGSDKIRSMIPGYSENFDPEREPIIRKITLNLIKSCLKLGLNVINDDLNYYKSMRHDLYNIASSLECHFLTLFFKVPLEKAIKWNEKRGSPIPNTVIKKVYNRLDEPGEYSWDIPLEILGSYSFENTEVIGSIYSKIITEIKKPLEKPQPLIKSKPGKSESLDKLTRKLISENVSKEIHENYNKQLSLMRKQFLIKAKKEDFSLDEVKEKFTKQILDFIKDHQ